MPNRIFQKKTDNIKSVAREMVSAKVSVGTSRKEATERGMIASLGTARTYSEALAVAIKTYVEQHGVWATDAGKQIDATWAKTYLADRAAEVGQKTLDKDRQALSRVLGEKLPMVLSEKSAIEHSRYLALDRIDAVANRQAPHNALATHIAKEAGLRSAELLTLQRIEDRPPDKRPEEPGKWIGRDNWASYTVKGKGGLVREVRLSPSTSAALEKVRIPGKGQKWKDRGIKGRTNYKIGGGNAWASSFNTASKRAFGKGEGGHSVRHTYARDRLREHMTAGASFKEAVCRVSQELGHQRPEIVFVYLR